MNYCSIEDAWGINCASNQYKEYIDNNTNNLNIEHFSETKVDKVKKDNSKSYNSNNRINNSNNKIDESYNCDSFMLHFKNCKKCYNKMKNQFKPKIIENFQEIIDKNRDTIVLILIGISILLFFNLINNITRN
jgi:hypothetical protein